MSGVGEWVAIFMKRCFGKIWFDENFLLLPGLLLRSHGLFVLLQRNIASDIGMPVSRGQKSI